MESSKKFLFKFDRNVLKDKDELKGVVFNEPRLIDYKEVNYNVYKHGNKILYFKKPKPYNYPIDLNRGFCTYTDDVSFEYGLNATLQYVMSSSSSSETEDTNVGKIKIFTQRGILMDIMRNLCPRRGDTDHRVFQVTRYNGDLYMVTKRHQREEPIKRHNSHDSQMFEECIHR